MTQSTDFLYSRKTEKIFTELNRIIAASPQIPVLQLKRVDYEALLSTTSDYVQRSKPGHLFYNGYRIEVF